MSKPRKVPKPVAGDRIQKLLSRAGIASRRASEELITDGRVTINGEKASLGMRVLPGDELRLDGELVSPPERMMVFLLNKPVGTLCSEQDPEGRPLVHHLLPDNLALRLVGRLDFNTEGVLLLTNDGELANRLSHPRHGVLREYEARVRGIPTAEVIAKLIRGVTLDDGPARVESARVVKQTDRNAWLSLTLTEGRNREVRRLLERVGHPVMRLRRVRFAGLDRGDLGPGNWRILLDREVDDLRERGHVGSFELPPDPRGGGRKSAKKRPGPSKKSDESKDKEPRKSTGKAKSTGTGKAKSTGTGTGKSKDKQR